MSKHNIFEGFYDCFDEFTHIDTELHDDKIVIDGELDRSSVIALARAFKLTEKDLNRGEHE